MRFIKTLSSLYLYARPAEPSHININIYLFIYTQQYTVYALLLLLLLFERARAEQTIGPRNRGVGRGSVSATGGVCYRINRTQ